ncbi:hypothetical protein JCM10450v2_005848 [Rhodotorula kratochvilovae]
MIVTRDPALARTIREQARVLANLRLRPESFTAAVASPEKPGRNGTGPLRPTAANLARAVSSPPSSPHRCSTGTAAAPSLARQTRQFSTAPLPAKALAHASLSTCADGKLCAVAHP